MIPHPLGRESERNLWGDLPNHSYCHIHNADELVPDNVYRVCFECGHVYATPTALEQAYTESVERMKQEHGDDGQWPTSSPVADNIYFCQECLHDF